MILNNTNAMEIEMMTNFMIWFLITAVVINVIIIIHFPANYKCKRITLF